MRLLLASIAVIFGVVQAQAQGAFTKGPEFDAGLVDCRGFYDSGTKCRRLAKDFAYDRNGKGWEAAAGLITDGASIPRWAQGFIGKPMTKAFAKAATLHDHYCRKENRVRGHLDVHRMFYNALRDSGVGRLKAGAMYAAVLARGPTWTKFAKPEKCNLLGDRCVRFNDGDLTDRPAENETPASYDGTDMEALLARMEKTISDEDLNADQIERLALFERTSGGLATAPSVLPDK